MLQEKPTTGEVSCRTEAPSVARLSTGAEGEEDEVASTAMGAATCTPEVAGAGQDPHPTSDPACQEAATERTVFPTDQIVLSLRFSSVFSIFSTLSITF
jgi:hypothetical protein